jgi:hypothetical protein
LKIVKKILGLVVFALGCRMISQSFPLGAGFIAEHLVKVVIYGVETETSRFGN